MKQLLRSRRNRVVAVVVVALGLMGALVAWAAGPEQDFAKRMILGRSITKLAIVVMANQTPIAQADAQAVLPALQAVRDTEKITEKNAVTLNETLLSSMPEGLRGAVEKVRLPQPRPEAQQLVLQRAARMRMGLDNPAAHGPTGLAYSRLLHFFEEAAAGKQSQL